MVDAKELHDWFTGPSPISGMDAEDKQTILRSLSLRAAAEANDGTTPETDAARLTINQRRMIAEGRGVVSEMVEASVARRLERERNGLARELAAARRSSAFWKAEHIAGNDVIERLQAELAKLRQAIDLAARAMGGEDVNDQGEAWDKCLRILDAARTDFPEGTK